MENWSDELKQLNIAESKQNQKDKIIEFKNYK